VKVLIDGVSKTSHDRAGQSVEAVRLGVCSHWQLTRLERFCLPWRAEP
jgi:hypothetical protein